MTLCLEGLALAFRVLYWLEELAFGLRLGFFCLLVPWLGTVLASNPVRGACAAAITGFAVHELYRAIFSPEPRRPCRAYTGIAWYGGTFLLAAALALSTAIHPAAFAVSFLLLIASFFEEYAG